MKQYICSFFLFAALASATTVQLTVVGAGTPALLDSTHNYVGPYQLTMNGQNISAMCMNDYDVAHGSWTANETVVSGTDFSKTYLGNHSYNVLGHQFTSAQIYTDEIYIFSELIRPNADRIDLQDAAWTIMDYATGHTPHSTNQAVTNIIANVEANAGSFNTSGFEILSQVNPGRDPEQEFIVATPEPSTLPLFAGGLLLAAFCLRRRTQQVVTA
jgi:hypothetical protein